MNSTTLQNLPRKCSLTEQSEHIETEDECFHLFINEEMIDDLILWANKKASESMPSNKKWKPVDRIEMDAFFGLLLLIGRFRESRECQSDLWKDNDALSTRFYAAVMSRDRFTDILRYIRFDDTATCEARKTDDKLAPIRHVTDTFIKNCKSCYNASDIGCVDECTCQVSLENMGSKYGRYAILKPSTAVTWRYT
ncbi:hypothetical protein WH47_04081 [Habropoda laboriosa]|uniref:PiggyBac transposable element-derived protein domain-containing protein n=1 Tax=Habropoda laboriosa TaxID=597456 RepID=A0A0L7QJI2_9HYME|nr:hypothetical protein WH47_04081 [Habropoda laboriosa]